MFPFEKINLMDISKKDVVRDEIILAINLVLSDTHHASAHLLAASAREILTTIGEKTNKETFFRLLSGDDDNKFSEAFKSASSIAGYLKHADRDHDKILSGFEEESTDYILYFACYDYRAVFDDMPTEAQVFEAWFWAVHADTLSRDQQTPKSSIETISDSIFPGIRNLPRYAQKSAGLRELRAQIKSLY